MRKKLLALALALCLLIGCTACAAVEKVTAFAMVHGAVEKTRALDAMDCTLDMQMDVTAEGMTMSVPVEAAIKAKGLQGDAPVASSAVTTKMLGMEMTVSMYQEGEWAYVQMGGEEYKVNVASVEASEYDYTDDVSAMLKDLPEELFEGIEAVKNEDGSATVTVPIPDDVFARVYQEFLNQVNDSAQAEGMQLAVTDAVVKITVADDYVATYDMSFNMKVDVMGMTTQSAVKASVKYNNPGTDVTVTPPAGYKDFEELSDNYQMGDMDDILDLG